VVTYATARFVCRGLPVLLEQTEETALANPQCLLEIGAVHLALEVSLKQKLDLLGRESLVDLAHRSLPVVFWRVSGGVHFSALNCPLFNFE
jgi:hypothetical protein